MSAILRESWGEMRFEAERRGDEMKIKSSRKKVGIADWNSREELS
jgi:hypothetical protein